MKKKIFLMCLVLVCAFFMLNQVRAQDLITVNIYEELDKTGETTYKASEHKKITLPFVNSISKMKVVYDEDINHSGITIANKEIEILGNLKGLHILYNADSLTIKGKVDYPIIISQNVIIEGQVTGDAIIYSPNVVVKNGASVAGDLIISTTNLNIEGHILGNVVAVVEGKCSITGTVDKALRITTGNVDLEKATIKGNILIKTNSDTSKVTEKYPGAVIEKIGEISGASEIKDSIINGVVAVLVFTAIGYILVRKDDNVFTKIYNKTKEKSVNVILSGAAVLLSCVVLVLLLIIISSLGAWIIGVPALLLYIAYIVSCCMLSVFIVGTVIFEAVKFSLIKKYEQNTTIKKLGLLFAIYTLLYALTVIPVISVYVIMVLCILSTGMVTVSLIKRK